MRNLKRALSLTLASVMLLGMMVVGSSAASYPDVEDTHNVEAIDVLQTIKVMVGDDNGNFGPDDQVNRAQMAVVMALLLDLDYDYYKGTNPFWDVPSWAEPYVAACYANGIVSGYNATTYGSGDPVTAVQAASMMMRALGYFQYQSDYKDGFELATVRQASKIGLLKDVNAASNTAALTRNQVAQLALNTLESTVVDAKDNTLNISGESGGMSMSVSGGQVDYIVRTSTEPFASAFSDNAERGDTATTGNTGYTVQLGEKLFNGDLKKDTYSRRITGSSNNPTVKNPTIVDDFDRPATRWTYKFNEIGTYADTPDYSYTKAASGNTPADKVKDMGLKGYEWDGEYVENGLTVNCGKTNAAALEYLADKIAADGVLIEVFMDDDNTNTIDTVTVIRTQMMQVSTVNAKEVTLKRLGDDSRANEGASPIPMGTLNGFINVKVVKEDDAGFDVLKDLKEDDYVLIVPVEDSGSYKVASAVVPETLEGVITNVYTKSGDTKIKAISVDNEKFNMSYAWTAEGDELRNSTNLSSKQTSKVYFDTYGYAIYVKDVKASNDVIIIDEAYQGLVDGKLVTYVDGWNTNGDEITLNLGTAIDTDNIIGGKDVDTIQGTVWEYASETANKAEYKLVTHGSALTGTVATPKGNKLVYAPAQQQWIKNGQFVADVIATDANYNTRLSGGTANEFLPMATNVKFIFLSIDSVDGNDVTGITIRDGVTSVGEDVSNSGVYDGGGTDKLKAISYVLNKDMDKVIAVVVADDEDAAVTQNLIFVKENNQHWIDKDGDNKTRTTFKAYDAEGNLIDNGESRLNMNVTNGSMNNRFFTYRQDSNGVYSVSEYIRTDRITSVSSTGAGNQAKVTITAVDDKGYFTGVGGKLNARYATVIDLDTGDEVYTNSAADMAQALKDKKATGFEVAYIFNGSDNVGAKTVSTMFVLKTLTSANTEYQITGSGATFKFCKTVDGTYENSLTGLKVGDTVYVKKVAADATKMNLMLSGSKVGSLVSGKTDIYSFTMTAGDKTEGNFSVAGVELPAGITDVNITDAANVKITYTGDSRPADTKVAAAIKATLEGAGYTVEKYGYDSDKKHLEFEASKSEDGISLPETFKFDVQAASTAYLVEYKVGGTAKPAITDTTKVGAADVANVAGTGKVTGFSFVKVLGTTANSYVLNSSTVKAGANYEATNEYVKVVITPTIKTSGATAGLPTGAAAEYNGATFSAAYKEGGEKLADDSVYVKLGEKIKVTAATTAAAGKKTQGALNVTGNVTGATSVTAVATTATWAANTAFDKDTPIVIEYTVATVPTGGAGVATIEVQLAD